MKRNLPQALALASIKQQEPVTSLAAPWKVIFMMMMIVFDMMLEFNRGALILVKQADSTPYALSVSLSYNENIDFQ